MPAPPDQWAARFAPGQVVSAYATVLVSWPDRDPVLLPILGSPSGSLDSGQVARRKVSALVASKDLPARVGPSAQVLVRTVLPSAPGVFTEVTQLAGQLTDGPRDEDQGVVRLDMASREDVILGHGMVRDRVFDTSALASLLSLVRGALPGEGVITRGVVDAPIEPVTVTPGGRARWDAIAQFATVLGAEFGATRGGSLRLRPIEGGDRDEWVVRRREPLPRPVFPPQPNVVVVTGKTSTVENADPAVGIAVDDRPGSPFFVGTGVVTRYQSDLGGDLTADQHRPLRTRHEELPIISTTAARVAARGLLIKGVRSADVTVQVPWNPWADWGDRLVVVDEDGAGLSLIVTGLDPLPLVPSPFVSVTGRLE